MADNSNIDPTNDGPSPSFQYEGLGNDNYNYDPHAVQEKIFEQIQGILADLKAGRDPSIAMQFLLYSMQDYGNQVIGLDALAQKKMNQYIAYAKQLSDDIQAGGNPPDPEDFKDKGGVKGKAYKDALHKYYAEDKVPVLRYDPATNSIVVDTPHKDANGNIVGGDTRENAVYDDLKAISAAVKNDPFFSKDNPDMGQNIQRSITNIMDAIYNGKDPHSSDFDWSRYGLKNFWQKYDPQLFSDKAGPTPPTPPDPNLPFNIPDNYDFSSGGSDSGAIHNWIDSMDSYYDKLNSYLDGLPPDEREAFEKEYGKPPAKLDWNNGNGWYHHSTQDTWENQWKNSSDYYNNLQNFNKNWQANHTNNQSGPILKDDSGGSTPNMQGDPTEMNIVMSATGTLNQQFTGGSQILGTMTQSHVETLKTEQSMFAKSQKNLTDMIKQMLSGMRPT